MTLSPEQVSALDNIARWLRQGSGVQPYFILGGYAGTGKTTLLSHFIDAMDQPPLCCAPTGKAASVLARKLKHARVSTVHHALYTPNSPSTVILEMLEGELADNPEDEELRRKVAEEKLRLSDVKLSFSLKSNREIMPGALVVIDEASMVNSRMFDDLLNTKARILFVGDPGQLPPVQDAGFFHNHHPDSMLTTIHRQALNSPIIRLSQRVRQGEEINYFEADGCRKVPKGTVKPEEWLKFDQVLTGKNETRRRINRFFRASKGFTTPWPLMGEKLICLKNDFASNRCFVNGVQCEALADGNYNAEFDNLHLDIAYEGLQHYGVTAYPYHFKVHYDAGAVEEPWMARHGIQEFDFGYAVTTHKSQGSEWQSVLLADDAFGVGEFRRRWLYTAITRARENFTWIA